MKSHFIWDEMERDGFLTVGYSSYTVPFYIISFSTIQWIKAFLYQRYVENVQIKLKEVCTDKKFGIYQMCVLPSL